MAIRCSLWLSNSVYLSILSAAEQNVNLFTVSWCGGSCILCLEEKVGWSYFCKWVLKSRENLEVGPTSKSMRGTTLHHLVVNQTLPEHQASMQVMPLPCLNSASAHSPSSILTTASRYWLRFNTVFFANLSFACHTFSDIFSPLPSSHCRVIKPPEFANLSLLGFGDIFALLFDNHYLYIMDLRTEKLISRWPLPEYRKSKRGSSFLAGEMSWLNGLDGQNDMGLVFATSMPDHSIHLVLWKEHGWRGAADNTCDAAF